MATKRRAKVRSVVFSAQTGDERARQQAASVGGWVIDVAERCSPMPRSYTFRRKFRVRSKEFVVCGRAGPPHDAINLKLAETGAARATAALSVSLDTAADLCDALAEYDAFYHSFRPLPADDAVLKTSRLVTDDGVYSLELAVRDYRQWFTIGQERERRTRSQPPAIAIPDMKRFRLVLAEIVEQLAAQFVPLMYWRDGELTKLVRGNRVAVLHCPARAWPWHESANTERLLFEPELARMILDKHEPDELHAYCERRYPDFVTEAYASGPPDARMRPLLDEFKCLSVRWVRIGAEFRVHRPAAVAGVVLRHEDHWFKA